MIHAPASRLVIPLILALAVACGSATAMGATETPAPAPAKTDHDAIQQAERDLNRLETEEKETAGWKVSDYLGVAALLAAIGLVFWASRWSRRFFFRQTTGRQMRVVDRMMTGKNSSLLLVQVRGRVYWLADTPGGITRLEDWPIDAEASLPPKAF